MTRDQRSWAEMQCSLQFIRSVKGIVVIYVHACTLCKRYTVRMGYNIHGQNCEAESSGTERVKYNNRSRDDNYLRRTLCDEW